jgi:hypothetical protein
MKENNICFYSDKDNFKDYKPSKSYTQHFYEFYNDKIVKKRTIGPSYNEFGIILFIFEKK